MGLLRVKSIFGTGGSSRTLVGSEKLPTGATPKSRQKPGRKRETYLKSSGPISQSSSCAWRMSSNTSSRTTPNGRVGANSVEASRLRRETRRGNNDNNLYRLCLSKEIPESYVSKRSFKEPLGIGATRTFLKIARDHPHVAAIDRARAPRL